MISFNALKSNVGFLSVCLVILFNCSMSVCAQDEYTIPACNFSKSHKFVGNRLRLRLPKDSIVNGSTDIDYETYGVGFGNKKNRSWLHGIFGAQASSGNVPSDWISSSSDIIQRTWVFDDHNGVDARGKLANGNYWRYLGFNGEEVKYYDVRKDAAEYFDTIIDNICYQG